MCLLYSTNLFPLHQCKHQMNLHRIRCILYREDESTRKRWGGGGVVVDTGSHTCDSADRLPLLYARSIDTLPVNSDKSVDRGYVDTGKCSGLNEYRAENGMLEPKAT